MTNSTLIIATRESPLALWQTNWVRAQLLAYHPHLSIKLLGLTTSADRVPYVSLAQIGGKGLFVKELEDALLDGRADIAVHSMKDVPLELPNGLCLPVICGRAEPRDVFISNQFSSFAELPQNALIGTSSLRRQSQLRAIRKDIQMGGLRGNVQTRLARLDSGEFAAIILAAAGLHRLNLENRISSYLSIEELLPAPGQAALGIECRHQDEKTRSLIMPLDHLQTHIAVTAERAMCKKLGGGCQVPIAAYAQINHDNLTLHGLVARVDGRQVLRAEQTASFDKAELLGTKVADDLLRQGAKAILDAI
jgi:hydroxymethylbilane synthase